VCETRDGKVLDVEGARLEIDVHARWKMVMMALVKGRRHRRGRRTGARPAILYKYDSLAGHDKARQREIERWAGVSARFGGPRPESTGSLASSPRLCASLGFAKLNQAWTQERNRPGYPAFNPSPSAVRSPVVRMDAILAETSQPG
jgi:hypothetical protein